MNAGIRGIIAIGAVLLFLSLKLLSLFKLDHLLLLRLTAGVQAASLEPARSLKPVLLPTSGG